MKTRGPILTLTTDFGTADGFIGAVKGRVLSIAPEAVLCDISHEVPPQDVWQGAWCLRRAAPQFPRGTVHLAVVDPGVGSQRAGVVVETERFLLVGPDNGVLTLAAQEDGIRRVVEIREDGEAWQKSASFDGLTLFAPVAAHLLAGMSLEEIGPEAEELVELPEQRPRRQGNVIEGAVVLFDHFGNAITNIAREELDDSLVERVVLNATLEARLCDHYAELAGIGRIGALINSDGRLELAVFGDSLQRMAGLHRGDPVRVTLRPR
jgi:hypothetical protein